jgi:uncharacterized protein DUF2703
MSEPNALLIEYIFDPDCPSHPEAFERLREVMDEEGVREEVRVVALTDDEQARQMRFLGSPTIRINGTDIEPGTESRHAYALSCRAYTKADGRISPLPPADLIRDALRRAAAGDRS